MSYKARTTPLVLSNTTTRRKIEEAPAAYQPILWEAVRKMAECEKKSAAMDEKEHENARKRVQQEIEQQLWNLAWSEL